ncbi:helix-turn-helix domain-containing protein [Flindersiella endophytica]
MSTPGPTVPRWRLGRQLTQLREAAGVTQEEVARLLGCSLKTARRMEHGEVSVARGDLLVLLNHYGVQDEEKRAELLDLQKRGRQRAWWSSLGPFYENNTSALLEFESAATSILIYESMCVPGLFQTAAYARALTAAMVPNLSSDDLERAVKLRLTRQEKLLNPNPPELFIVLDESVVRRPVGGPEAHREQLEHLIEIAEKKVEDFRIVPMSAGAYPGFTGQVMIFEFGSGVREPVMYAEGRAGNLYVEEADDVQGYRDAFSRMNSVAFSRDESLAFTRSILNEI